MTDSFATMIAYTRWADRALLTPCGELTPAQYTLELGGSFPTLQATVAHLAGSAKLWSLRVSGQPYSGIAPANEIPDVPTALARLGEAYAAFLQIAPEWQQGPDEIFHFRNIAGAEKSVVRWQVLRHIVNHHTYHRGQIAHMLRQLGVTPPSTDLLYWDGS